MFHLHRLGTRINEAPVREPYQVLLDSRFIVDAAKFKMHLGKMLENTLSGTIKPMSVVEHPQTTLAV